MSPRQQLERFFGNLFRPPATPGFFRLCYAERVAGRTKKLVKTLHLDLTTTTLDELVEGILEDGDLPHDTYFTLATARHDPEDIWARGDIASCLAVRMLWFDIDLNHPAHKPKDLPYPELEHVVQIMSQFPDASMAVHSGYGLHLYWDLDRPYMVDPMLCRRIQEFQRPMVAAFKAAGFWCDDTSDVTLIAATTSSATSLSPSGAPHSAHS